MHMAIQGSNENFRGLWLRRGPLPLNSVLRSCHSIPESVQLSAKKTRSIVERSIGIWKSRFRSMDKSGGLLCYSPEKVSC
jgi:hypothetical protein